MIMSLTFGSVICGTVPHVRVLLMYQHLKPISALTVVCEYCLFCVCIFHQFFFENFHISA